MRPLVVLVPLVAAAGACRSSPGTPQAAAPAPAVAAPVAPVLEEVRRAPAMAAPAPVLLERARPEPPIVAAHNRVRAEHCAPPLTWSDELAAEATAWANQLTASGCAFEHSQSDHGENLAAGTSGALDADAVVAMWAREEEKFDFKRPAFSMKTGHFTQVVWKDTLAVGCGVATCGGRDTWVCNYDPPGNVEGDFALNVAPQGCR